jgi:hypothetical protein
MGEYILYIVGLVQGPNIYWVEILPVHKVQSDNINEIASAIEDSRLISHPYTTQAQFTQETKRWDGDSKKVWKEALRLISIRWFDDGSVLIVPKEPFTPHDEPDLGEGVGWKRIRGAEIELASPVLPEVIARQIIVLISQTRV